MASARTAQLRRELSSTGDIIHRQPTSLIRTQAIPDTEVASRGEGCSDELQLPVQNGSVDAMTSANYLRQARRGYGARCRAVSQLPQPLQISLEPAADGPPGINSRRRRLFGHQRLAAQVHFK